MMHKGGGMERRLFVHRDDVKQLQLWGVRQAAPLRNCPTDPLALLPPPSGACARSDCRVAADEAGVPAHVRAAAPVSSALHAAPRHSAAGGTQQGAHGAAAAGQHGAAAGQPRLRGTAGGGGELDVKGLRGAGSWECRPPLLLRLRMLLNACYGRCMHHPAVNTDCFNTEGSYSQLSCTGCVLKLAADSVLQRHGNPLLKRRALHTTMQASFLSSRPAHAAAVASSASCRKLGAALPGLVWDVSPTPVPWVKRACQAAAGGAPFVSLLQAACCRVQSRFGARQGCRSTGLARDRVSRRPHLLGPRALPRRPWRTGSRTGSNERRSQVRPSVL